MPDVLLTHWTQDREYEVLVLGIYSVGRLWNIKPTAEVLRSSSVVQACLFLVHGAWLTKNEIGGATSSPGSRANIRFWIAQTILVYTRVHKAQR